MAPTAKFAAKFAAISKPIPKIPPPPTLKPSNSPKLVRPTAESPKPLRSIAKSSVVTTTSFEVDEWLSCLQHVKDMVSFMDEEAEKKKEAAEKEEKREKKKVQFTYYWR